ncbi:MAG TPA: chemotaxis protein CheB [Rhodanobacter sp.]|nr:chemotaxis protein CheB [Rhodanobacter sp.]
MDRRSIRWRSCWRRPGCTSEAIFSRPTSTPTRCCGPRKASTQSGTRSSGRAITEAGGTQSLASYYSAGYDFIKLDQRLRRHITFASHNLVADKAFCEAHLVLCRNVLIYFSNPLQNRTLALFRDSLVRGGYLCMGLRETQEFAPMAADLLPSMQTCGGTDEKGNHHPGGMMIRPEAIAIGCSKGGFNALKLLLGALDRRLPQTLLVCCHSASGAGVLSGLLASHSALPVVEASERQPARGGTVYVAPGGYHLLLEHDRHFALSVDDPVYFSRPSIDVLFGSAADVYHAALIGVVLTGANRNGADGLAQIRARGGIAVVQTPASAEAAAMPQAALDTAGADHCLPLEQIAPLLNRLCLT